MLKKLNFEVLYYLISRSNKKKPANFFLIFEIFQDISKSEDKKLTFSKYSYKRAKLLAKKEKKFSDSF